MHVAVRRDRRAYYYLSLYQSLYWSLLYRFHHASDIIHREILIQAEGLNKRPYLRTLWVGTKRFKATAAQNTILRLYIGLYNKFINLIPIQTFQINSILSIRLIWNAKQFNSIRASSEDLKDLLAPLFATHSITSWFIFSSEELAIELT